MTEPEYDVCLSFASEQRPYVEKVNEFLIKGGVRVFYDQNEQADAWGKDLSDHLDSVYRHRAKYCIIFASKQYSEKNWTSRERRSALARALSEKREYVLPARFDDTELPGIPDTVAYIDLRRNSPQQLAELFIAKLRGVVVEGTPISEPLFGVKRASIGALVISAVIIIVVALMMPINVKIDGRASSVASETEAAQKTLESGAVTSTTVGTAGPSEAASPGQLQATTSYLQSNVGMFSSVLTDANAGKAESFLKRRNDLGSEGWVSRLEAEMAEGAYVLGGATVNVELKNPSQKTVVIHDIRVTELKREPAVTGVLFFVQPQGGDRRQIGFNLDSPAPEAKVIDQRDSSLGKPFFTEEGMELVPQKTELLTMRLSATEAAYSFQIAVDYNDGQNRSLILGGPRGEPYKMRVTAALCKNPRALTEKEKEFLSGSYGTIYHPVMDSTGNYRFQSLDPATFMRNNCNDI